MSTPADRDHAGTHLMPCMEVWGGNQAIDNGVAMPGLDAWVYSRPYQGDASGGDVHYVSSCGTGRIARVLVADVSGHGAGVGEIALNLRSLMRRYVNYLDQTRFVESVNREFASISRAGGFATCVATTYFAPSDHLTVSNAGHPRPLLYRARRNAWQLLIPGAEASRDAPHDDLALLNLPLGIIEPARYDQFGVHLHPGDLVLIYTDSLIEAMDPQGTQLGETGLLDLVRRLDPSRPERLNGAILEAVSAHRGGAPAEDDVTLLLLRHNGSRPRMTFAERLAAQVKFLGMVARRLIPGAGGGPIPWPELRWENIVGAVSQRAGRRWGRDTPDE